MWVTLNLPSISFWSCSSSWPSLRSPVKNKLVPEFTILKKPSSSCGRASTLSHSSWGSNFITETSSPDSMSSWSSRFPVIHKTLTLWSFSMYIGWFASAGSGTNHSPGISWFVPLFFSLWLSVQIHLWLSRLDRCAWKI